MAQRVPETLPTLLSAPASIFESTISLVFTADLLSPFSVKNFTVSSRIEASLLFCGQARTTSI